MAPGKRILICEDVTGTGIKRLEAKYEVTFAPELWKALPQLEESVKVIEALIARNQTKVTASLLAKAKELRVIGRAGAGYDNIDVNAASQAGVVIRGWDQWGHIFRINGVTSSYVIIFLTRIYIFV